METETPVKQSAQERFDERYICSSEIARCMQVSRTTVHQACKRGLLPDAVLVSDSLTRIWERATVRPYLDAWRVVLAVRRGVTT